MEGKEKELTQQAKIGSEVPREEQGLNTHPFYPEGRWWLREKIQERWQAPVLPGRSSGLELRSLLDLGVGFLMEDILYLGAFMY